MSVRRPGVGVVVGRFQVPELTEGHVALLEEAGKHAKMCVGIGVSSQTVTQDDPLDYPSREQMLREQYYKAQILPIHDQPLDRMWVQTLDRMVSTIYQFAPITFYHGRDSGFEKVYKANGGRYEVVAIDPVNNVSGTAEREKVAHGVETSRAWRAGAIHAAYNQWPRINFCVDIGVTRLLKTVNMQFGRFELLVGSRVDEGGAVRLPGGHVDITDSGSLESAVRELQEETGLEALPSDLHYVGNFRVKSWRKAKNSALFTSLYHADYKFGAAKAMDDIDRVHWIPINAIDEVKWADDHYMLATQIRSYLFRETSNESKPTEED